MEVFRLSRLKFAGSLSGTSAALKGARWNSIGVELIYTASNRSLAMAEVAVHLSLSTLPDDYKMLTIFVPDNTTLIKLDPAKLPPDWNAFPHSTHTQAFGDKFVLENKSCVLQVPSAVTKGDHNYLINPNHKDFAKIKIIDAEKFPFDKRIFK